MLFTLAVVAVVLVAAVLAYAATRPDQFRIERSIAVEAPPAAVHALVDDFRAWTRWSPWEGIDPALKRTYGGPPAGVGATYAWEGNRNVGAGRMEITESSPGERIAIRLDFIAPMAAKNTAEFTFVPEGAATRVTWAMFGPSPFLSKLMGLVFNMDRMVGGMFEKGLASLKAQCESDRRGR